jgi:hypothetical protein
MSKSTFFRINDKLIYWFTIIPSNRWSSITRNREVPKCLCIFSLAVCAGRKSTFIIILFLYVDYSSFFFLFLFTIYNTRYNNAVTRELKKWEVSEPCIHVYEDDHNANEDWWWSLLEITSDRRARDPSGSLDTKHTRLSRGKCETVTSLCIINWLYLGIYIYLFSID